MSRIAVFVAVTQLACATTGMSNQGALDPKQAQPALEFPVEALFDVCWPEDASPGQQVTLQYTDKGLFFETSPGVSNSTARCMREVALNDPKAKSKSGAVLVKPPTVKPDGWKVLAFVKLLAPSRLQTLSGIADPTAAVRACLAGGSGSFRRDIPFEVRFSPALNVSVPGGTVSERERCVAAVLGSTNWPSTRPFDVVFADGASSAAAAATESWPYFEPEGERLAALPPDIVKDALSSRKAAVAACWESAIARRSALSGGRTVRFRIRNQTTRAWVVSNASDAPAASPDALLDRCLVEVVQKLTLSMDGEGVYSWVFAERG